MGAPKKNSKKTSASQKPSDAISSISRRRRMRLSFGILSLLAGIFIAISIISYCFTWKSDQDKFLSGERISHFMFSGGNATIENWGGRMGAATAHVLVYQGVGIAALAIGIWLATGGINLIYNNRRFLFMRYLRWLGVVLLITAPVMAYIMPNTAFPYGGALGNEAIFYLNGLLGNAGTGMLLIALAAFLIFVVFALDLTPAIRKARLTAKAVAATLRPEPVFAANKNADPAPTAPVMPVAPVVAATATDIQHDDEDVPSEHIPATITNRMHGEDGPITIDEETGEVFDQAITLTEKEKPEPKTSAKKTQPLPVVQDDPPFEINESKLFLPADEPVEDLALEELTEEPETNEEPELLSTPSDELELSFEVIKQEDEAPAIAHGSHVSIEDNEPYAPELDLPSYKFPTLDLLEDRSQETITLDKEELEKNKNQILQTLRSFGIEIQRISATVGPTVTLYEIVPAEGVRISKIRNLEDDIALNLAALGIRIIAPIPGRGTIGIEVPNANKQIVSMRALLASDKFANSKMSLPIALGKKIDNENYIVDLATMPHLLVAGATGQGKSVGINAILVSLLYKKHPSQLKFVMIDPKKVELSVYRLIEKHFLAKLPDEEEAIITDTKKVIYTLNALCIEMDNRYELLKEAGARNIKEYNDKFIKRRLNPQRGHKFLPFIVLVIDEFADLIMTAGKEVEMPIARLAQLARAIGIHLIIATQRPSVNVITGTIKANFPGRIAFKVSAKVDSRTILDAGGAEQLIGRGDMLVSHGSELLRLQCAFVDTPEVENIVEFIGNQRGYPSAFELPEYEGEETEKDKTLDLTNRDKLFEDCARTVVQTQSGSTSMLQRRYNLGYNRAGRIMDQLEASGIVGPSMGSKPRDVLYKTEAELEQFLSTIS